MAFWNHFSIVITATGVLIAIATLLVEKISHRRIVAVVGIVIIMFGIGGYFFVDQQSIIIIEPLRGTPVQGMVNPDDNQVTIHNISVQVARPIEKDEKIVILMQVRGGQWYVSGNQLNRAELTRDNIGHFGYITFGQLNDGKNNWAMLAIITSKDLKTKKEITDPVEYAKHSDTANFLKNGLSINRVQ